MMQCEMCGKEGKLLRIRTPEGRMVYLCEECYSASYEEEALQDIDEEEGREEEETE